GVPWIHSLFQNAAAVASGVEAALRIKGKLDQVRVISQGGDGATADIGMASLSGMFDRGHDILYVCYDNEAYMNTGVQRSGLTPFDSRTTTSPSGKKSFGNPRPKKNIPEIANAHNVPYVATASVAFPKDLQKKVKKALSIRGPKYIQIFVPCPLGWRHDPGLTYEIAKLVVETGLYPILEYQDGKLISVKTIDVPKPVDEYLKLQGRYAHLFTERGKGEIAKIQAIADSNIKKYGLLKEGKGVREKMVEEKFTEEKIFTTAELSKCDGKDGRPAYFAYKGKVYETTGSDRWADGTHYNMHFAGSDLTEALVEAPHGEEVFERFKVVGVLKV
ncbi:MAG TPA: thiamine pyrophosphate-dependent enzyme, partial [Candidatus Wunengus sp. YC61]|uniref:thiamine pyrophosphate-dependent enzyme n=1 Tax=Candidatus Wunengus sp. YC61 TaxID=3367698 RepID=UPI0040281E5E